MAPNRRFCLMRPNITINIPEPYLTVKEYARRTKLHENTVREMIKDGRLPIRKKQPSGKQCTVFINMLALYVEASGACNVSLQTNQQG